MRTTWMRDKINLKNILIFCCTLYSGCVIMQNILATKQIQIGIFAVTAGVIVSPITFIIQDIMSEIYGYSKCKKMILLGFFVNLLAVILIQLAIIIPPSPIWENQIAFETILGTTLRISLSSFTAYLLGSLTNAKIMTKLKQKHEKNLFIRAITSTFAGQLLDNLLFAFLAFYGILPLQVILSIIVSGTLIEVVYELLLYPIIKNIIKFIKNIHN